MDTRIHDEPFPHDKYEPVFPIPEEHLWVSDVDFLPSLFWGGYFDGDALYIYRFLREDLSINLEQLELATIKAVEYLNTVVEFDKPITLYLEGLDEYYQRRGISDKPKNMKEEFYVVRGIVEAVANNESVKPIKVEYVQHNAHPLAGGQ